MPPSLDPIHPPEVSALLDRYWAWLRDRAPLRQVGGWVEITTPYLDPHNDYLQIYVQRAESGYLLTDDGAVLADLEQSGRGGPEPQSLLEKAVASFGVQVVGRSLEVTASADDFAFRLYSLVQAMRAAYTK